MVVRFPAGLLPAPRSHSPKLPQDRTRLTHFRGIAPNMEVKLCLSSFRKLFSVNEWLAARSATRILLHYIFELPEPGMQGAIGSPKKQWRGCNTHTRDVVVGTDTLGEQPVPNLPREDRGTLPFVLSDLLNDVGRGHTGLGPSDGPRLDGARLVVPGGEQRGRCQRRS